MLRVTPLLTHASDFWHGSHRRWTRAQLVRALGLTYALGYVRLLRTLDDCWVPVDIHLGIPLFSVELCRQVRPGCGTSLLHIARRVQRMLCSHEMSRCVLRQHRAAPCVAPRQGFVSGPACDMLWEQVCSSASKQGFLSGEAMRHQAEGQATLRGALDELRHAYAVPLPWQPQADTPDRVPSSAAPDLPYHNLLLGRQGLEVYDISSYVQGDTLLCFV